MDTDKKKIACFTGHRKIRGADLRHIQEKLDNIISDLIKKGVLYYMSGGAVGFDTLAAHAVLKAREFNSEVKLIMVLPCVNQDSRWSEAEKKAYRCLLDNADKIIYVSEQPYFDGCMQKRNLYLTGHSGFCVAYMTHGRSGTSQTVRFSRERGLTVINLADNIKGVRIMVDFEKAFGEFIDSSEYDKADETVMEMLFTVARSSFKAGFIAAGGEAPQEFEGIKYTRPSREIPLNTEN